jgi:RNA polymerase sigma factor (sigma-70 family)
MSPVDDAIDGRGEEWFVALYECCYDDVLRYARRRVDEESARDVAAETFVVAWRRPDVVPAVALPWLYGVARRVLANESRRVRRQDRVTMRVAAMRPSPIDETHRVGETQIMAAALAELSAADREAVRLIAWEGLNLSDAALAAGCSRGAFAVRLHRARRRLQAAVGGEQSEAPSIREHPVARIEPTCEPGTEL